MVFSVGADPRSADRELRESLDAAVDDDGEEK
jgi:hypothetical protein